MPGKPIDLTGRRALVTGASRGIGRAVAVLLAEAGAKVAVHYGAAKGQAERVAEELAGRGHAVVGCNLVDPDRAADLPVRAAEALGGLDIVVNNAGIYERHGLGEVDDRQWAEAWDRTLAVNLTAPARIIQGALPFLSERGGHVVNIGSRGAFRGEPSAPAYGAAKAGLHALGQSLALALAPRGIHVISIAPGWVETDMTRTYLAGAEGDEVRGQSPLNRTATAEEVAEVVLLAVSGRADALTGGIIDVNCASYLRT